MCVTAGLLVEGEEFSEFAKREVTLHVLLLVHHTAAQGFLMGLSLQDLLLDGPRLKQKQSCQTFLTAKDKNRAAALMRVELTERSL